MARQRGAHPIIESGIEPQSCSACHSNNELALARMIASRTSNVHMQKAGIMPAFFVETIDLDLTPLKQSLALSFDIDYALSKLGQLLVRLPLLIERLLKKRLRFFVTE